MGAQNFYFAPKFLQIGGFHLRTSHFWTKYFRREKDFCDIFSTAQNLMGQLPFFPAGRRLRVLWDFPGGAWEPCNRTVLPAGV